MRMATPRRSVPRREMRWERWATRGQVKNWTREVTLKIKPTKVVEALNSSFMYKGKKGPKQLVMVADHVMAPHRKARKAQKEEAAGGGFVMVVLMVVVPGVGGRGGGRSLGRLLACPGSSSLPPMASGTPACSGLGLGWCLFAHVMVLILKGEEERCGKGGRCFSGLGSGEDGMIMLEQDGGQFW